MINILFIIHRLSYGGAEKILTFLANEISNDCRYKVYIYTYEDTSMHYIVNDNVFFMGESQIANKRGVRRVRQVLQIRKVIKETKANVVISFLNMPNILSIIAGKLTHTPMIISERGDPYQLNSLSSKLIHFAYRFTNGMVFQTEGAREFFPWCLQKKGRVIPNPVFLRDNSITANVDSPDNEISFVARFENVQKRQDIMLKAFKIVNERYPEMILKFYGDGPDLNYIKSMVKDMELNEKVFFMGLSSNSTKDISNSRVFVLTSDYEGIPNALIEAMAIGMPVVSTDCSPGGARLLIEDGVNGLLVPVGDPLSIADAIIKFIESPDLARQCGGAARQIITSFAPEKIINQWKEYINEICRRQA